MKRKERANSTLDGEQNPISVNGYQQPNHGHHNTHLMGNNSGAVQVSQGGTLLIGPGGRPKTSQGKNI